MRDYAKVSPLFWTRGSGKRLRGDPEAQVLALYLVTCPNANMVGIYYVPFVAIAHESGLGAERTTAALQRLADSGFAFYDDDAELAWVPNMASYQIGDKLKDNDNRRGGPIRAELEKVGRHPFVRAFWNRYAAGYGLGECPLDVLGAPDHVGNEGAPCIQTSPPIAPTKGVGPHSTRAGEEQEQEQEQEQEKSRSEPVIVVTAAASHDVVKQETVSKTRKGSRMPRTFMRDDWMPTEEHAAYVRSNGLDLSPVISDFRNHWLSQGEQSANWNARFRQNVDRILRTDWLIARFAAPPDSKPLPMPHETYGPPSDPPPGLLEQMQRLATDSKPALLREVLAEDAERGSDVRIAVRPPTGTGG